MTDALWVRPDRNRSSRGRHRVVGSLLVSGVVTALTLGSAFGLRGLGVGAFWVAYPVGFGVVLPSVLSLVNYHWLPRETEADDSRGTGAGDRLEELRLRYARGELSEVEFERRLDRLFEASETR